MVESLYRDLNVIKTLNNHFTSQNADVPVSTKLLARKFDEVTKTTFGILLVNLKTRMAEYLRLMTYAYVLNRQKTRYTPITVVDWNADIKNTSDTLGCLITVKI